MSGTKPINHTHLKGLPRRDFLRGLATGLAASSIPTGLLFRRDLAQAAEGDDGKRFLVVVTATGGGSIVDSFLPAMVSQLSDPALAATVNAFQDTEVSQPAGSNIRAVNNLGNYLVFGEDYSPSNFLADHYEDMVVMTNEVTSVNHQVAQKRSVTGASINGGRTLMEAVASVHGAGMPLPNCNMSVGGYIEPGDDPTVPDWARSEIIADPFLFAAGTHGRRGVVGVPSEGLVNRARGLREQLDDASPFGKTFEHSALRSSYLKSRREKMPLLESEDLITKLMMVGDAGGLLSGYGLASTPDIGLINGAFPYLTEPLQAQAALAYLLIKNKASSVVTLGPSFQPSMLASGSFTTALAFDFSHNNHRFGQNVTWSVLLKQLHFLIELLKLTPYNPENPEGGSFWDRTLVYVATEFGRSQDRPPGVDIGAFGSGHGLNNGNLLISPLLKGNTVFGGVNHDTAMTYGFDPVCGAPTPGVQQIREGHVYSAICQALGVSFPGQHDMSALMAGSTCPG